MPITNSTPYRGRFAPSPTGPLHLGSLTTALASFLDARKSNGTWLLRIEDVDPLREQPDATEQIIETLALHGLNWDEPYTLQSQRASIYEKLIQRLQEATLAYRCWCSRKELKANQGKHLVNCERHRHHPVNETQQPDNAYPPFAIRMKVPAKTFTWQDQLLGEQSFVLTEESDDFVIKRKEGFYAYHLAVVCDDIEQNITHIVRGADLLDSTPFHLHLYQSLNASIPTYSHTPIVRNREGQKLSKQNKAPAIENNLASENLLTALTLLGATPPGVLKGAKPDDILAWGIEHWNIAFPKHSG